jgi:hypothetical protein
MCRIYGSRLTDQVRIDPRFSANPRFSPCALAFVTVSVGTTVRIGHGRKAPLQIASASPVDYSLRLA